VMDDMGRTAIDVAKGNESLTLLKSAAAAGN
jgi:hypothetical protein